MSLSLRAAATTSIALLTLISVEVPLRAQEGFDGLVVRIYDMTGIDRQRRAEAIDAARAILTEAGVEAEWLDCRRAPGAETTGCDAWRRPTDLIVRIVRGSLETASGSSPALGVAVIDAPAGIGTLATIFIDRLEPVARRSGADATLLLARTIAHEVGHLLLRTSDHGTSGLMRATWTDTELAQNRPEDWVFAAHERGQLRTFASLSRRSLHPDTVAPLATATLGRARTVQRLEPSPQASAVRRRLGVNLS
jgi:hypothetical protein